MTYPVDGGTSKPMTSLLLFIFYDCITVFCTAGHVLTEEQSEEYYTAVTSDCRRARRSSALEDLYLRPWKAFQVEDGSLVTA